MTRVKDTDMAVPFKQTTVSITRVSGKRIYLMVMEVFFYQTVNNTLVKYQKTKNTDTALISL